MTDRSRPTRRDTVLGVCATAAAGLGTPAEARAAPLVAMLGDSLTAGFGLRPEEALPVQLRAALERRGRIVRVRGAGVNGDTTAGALRRVDRDVPQGADVCVVALGANDLFQGVAPSRMRANLDAILERVKAKGARPVVAGMRAPPILDPAYVRAFDQVFPTVAREHDALFYPFLLDGVALIPRYNLPDRIHPNAQGVRIVAERLAPTVARALPASA